MADQSATNAGVTFGNYVARGAHPARFMSEKEASGACLSGASWEAIALEREGRKLLSTNSKCSLPSLSGLHVLVAASHICFEDHLPLVLSPDMIWLTIAQGLSQHINSDPEKFRYRFVEHDGQLQLDVFRDEFIRGSPSNDWPGVFKEFSGKIRDHIGAKTHDLLVPTFSTTTPVSAAAAEIVLMEVMQAYFKYDVHTRCAIPSFTILGTPRDWKSIRDRVLGFLKIDPDLSWWTDVLVTVIEQFIHAVEGKADLSFWKSWYKFESVSGGELVTGAILSLFPYIKLSPNKFLDYRRPPSRREFHVGVNVSSFPSSLAKAPFTWHYLGTTLPIAYVSGLMAMSYDKGQGVKPVVGWAVLQPDKALEEAEPKRKRWY